MPRIPTAKKTRLNLELSEPVRKRLEALRVRTDADSLAEVIRKALTLYDLVVTERTNGGELLLRKAGEEQTVIIL